MNLENIPGVKRLAKTPDGQDITGMVQWQGHVVVSTSQHIYRLAQRRKGKYVLVPIKFVSTKKAPNIAHSAVADA